LDNLDRNDASGSGKKRLEVSLSDLAGKVCYVDFPVHVSSIKIPDLLKHSRQSSFLSSGGKTGVMTSFPQPEHTTL
jgi:hypothetical protein